MTTPDSKTGQKVDSLKETLLTPLLVEHIIRIAGTEKTISLVDLGAGDATSMRSVIQKLSKANYPIQDLGLLDADIQIFPDLGETVLTEPLKELNIQLVHSRKRYSTSKFIELFEEKYDVGLSQLVVHQIENDSEASYLMYLGYRALKPEGSLLLVNLHPQYLRYLSDYEPEKFRVTNENKRQFSGTYHFDDGGAVDIWSRSPEVQLSTFLGLGFDLTAMIPITTDSIQNLNPRYKYLAEAGIPMFYLMELKKNPKYFISSTEGIVQEIKQKGQKQIQVTFMDHEKVYIPAISNWREIEPGSNLILHEVYRKEIGQTLLTYWVIDQTEKVTGGQVSIS